MRTDIRPGAAFPDYQLPDHTGTPRRLSEIQGSDPTIIVLAREAYSAKDQRQHEGLVQLWSEMKPGVGYCRMVTITTSDPQETFNYRSGVNAEWPFLSDNDRIVQRDLDIAEYTDPAHHRMRARPGHLQDLQRLLVLRAADRRRAADGPAGGVAAVPLGLGPVRPAGAGRLGSRPDRSLLPAGTGLATGPASAPGGLTGPGRLPGDGRADVAEL